MLIRISNDAVLNHPKVGGKATIDPPTSLLDQLTQWLFRLHVKDGVLDKTSARPTFNWHDYPLFGWLRWKSK
jgi:hypothetical protein